MIIKNEKDKYFKISRDLSLPMRCPLLNRCGRRAETLCVIHHKSKDEVLVEFGFLPPLCNVIGEDVHQVGGVKNYYYSGFCPEVSLFEPEKTLNGFSGMPSIKGEYDYFFNDPKYHVLETGHFSQCAEFVMNANKIEKIEKVTLTSWLRANWAWLGGFSTLVVTIIIKIAKY